VLFAVPWQGKLIVGTTDTPRDDLPIEPRPLPEEVDFILAEASRYLARTPTRADVRSCWAGLRPLVKPPAAAGRDTKAISREHAIVVSRHALLTVTGGKWTTYRAMAEDVLAACFRAGLLPERPAGVTRTLPLLGAARGPEGEPSPASPSPVTPASPPGLHLYGTEASLVAGLPGADRELLPGLSEAMVRFAVRHEFARTVEDVLARRSRWLFLDAAAAADAADAVAAIMADELAAETHPETAARFDPAASAAAFRELARGYRLPR